MLYPIRLATYEDINKIKELVNRLIEENKFYFDYSNNGMNSYRLYDTDFIENLIKNGDVLLIYEENGKLLGISHWSIIEGIHFNVYTAVSDSGTRKGIAKQFYYYFLSKNIPAGAEFIIYTPTSSKIFNIWYQMGTKIFGFSASKPYYNNTNNFSTILGFRPNENEIKLKIPRYSENFIKKLCKINNLECRLYIIEEKRKKNVENRDKVSLTKELEKCENNGCYLTGFMFNRDKTIYYYSNNLNKDVEKNLEKFFQELRGEYFEKAQNILFSYIDTLKSI
ncbi:MAG: GNAT family N-acetyltransferase [Nanopusillaceae archaeon]